MNASRAGHVVLTVALCVLTCALNARAASVPFWGARTSSPADTPINQLQHGQFIWLGDAVRAGPMAMIVSLSEQRAYVYRNGVLIGVSTVSTGKPGHETPTGVFTVLQKDRDHRSTIYDDAPMPYMQRLTWGGVALHAGGLPGYPESHGCVHLPSEFARQLFAVTDEGMTVVVASEASAPREVAHPGYLAPIDSEAGQPSARARLLTSETMRWTPDAAPEGPVSMVLSRLSGRIVVYRAGIEIGRARVIFRGSEPIGTHALILIDGPAKDTDARASAAFHEHWVRVAISGHADEAGQAPDAHARDRLEIPEDFVRELYAVLTPGTTVLVTDEPLLPSNSGAMLEVINADPTPRTTSH